NDALIDVDALRAARAHHFEYVRAHEPPGAAHHIDLALLHENLESAGQLRDYRALPGTQALQVELRRAESDAARAHLLGILDDLGGVQERFRRNAADVEAQAAELLPALDERHLEPEICRSERRRVAPRSGAQHQELRAAVEFLARAIGRAAPRRGHAHGVSGGLPARRGGDRKSGVEEETAGKRG